MSKQGLSQHQQLAQKQITSQQTVQLMKMIELSNVALEEEILKSVDENPALDIKHDDIEDEFVNQTENNENENDNADDIALEVDRNHNEDPFDNDFFAEDEQDEDIPAYRLYADNYSDDSQKEGKLIAFDHSLQEQLLLQLNEMDLDDRAAEIGKYIIGNLDDNGYLTRESTAISNELLFSYNIKTSPAEIEHIITHYIQELEPAGIGARDLQECLLLQLKRKNDSPSILIAREIIAKHFDSFSKKHFDKLCQQLNLDEKDFKAALAEIKNLDPHPVSNDSFIEKNTSVISPDFLIHNCEGKLDLTLNNVHIPKVTINQDFTKEYHFLSQEKNDKLRSDAEKFLKENLDNANNFIHLLSLREMILYNTMLAIMQRQEKYFLSGDESELKPMILKDIAEKVNLDISTVSRVTSSKYVQTDFGIILLKDLFSEAAGDEDVSSRAIKKLLAEIIDSEDKNKPYTDDQLCEILKDKGYTLARRTIAKYREQLNYPKATLRKEINL